MLINILGAFLTLFLPLLATAQSVTYLSNLEEPGQNPEGVAANHWVIETFRTGLAANGYVLNTVQMTAGAVGRPIGNFRVYLYSGAMSPIATLVGPNPSVVGTYSYAASGVFLPPSTAFGIVATATFPFDSNNYFFWNRPGLSLGADMNYSSVDNWEITGFNPEFSSDGTFWLISYIVVSPFQFAVSATPVSLVLSSSLTNDGFNFSFNTISSLHYSVQYKTNLTDAAWISFSTLTGDGSVKSYTVPATNDAHFFRVSIP